MTSTLDYPALDGRPVTQAHTTACTARGHASHTIDGIPTGTCPRCGANTAHSDVADSVVLSSSPADPYRAACVRRCTCGHYSSAHANFSGPCRAWQGCDCSRLTQT